MESIIQQIAVGMIEEVLNILEDTGLSNIGKTIQRLQKVSNNAILSILSEAIHEGDAAIVNATQKRAEHGLTIKERNVPRTLTTDIGELTYTRTYYKCKDGGYCYPMDSVIGAEPYERITKELCASMVQSASENSMEKASKGLVSRQTVNNKVLALKQVVIEAEAVPYTPSELHLFADEDHVHMKSGRSSIVPLVTVTEGIDTEHRRHRTLNAIHFEGYGMDNQNFFEGIASFLDQKYDMTCVKHIYLHGDGGRWIDEATNWFPNISRVMDGYHLTKRLKRIARLQGAAVYMANIYTAIREDNFERFVGYCSRIEDKQDGDGRDVLRNEMIFIQNNWNAIVLRMKGTVCGSCTEAMVSHVLSKRLSRNPMGRSEDGLRQISMLRVYTQNGGVVTSKDIRVLRSKTERKKDSAAMRDGFECYRAYADNRIKDFLNNRPDWSIFEPAQYSNGKIDGTRMLLKAYGLDHGVSIA